MQEVFFFSFSLHVQSVCGPDLQFYNIVYRWPGSIHDSRVFSNCSLHVQLQAGDYDGHLLGDSAYPPRPFLMIPVLNPSQQSEVKYNLAELNKTRIPIERTFGAFKRRFRCLSIPMRTSLETTMATVCRAVVLHNIALQVRDGLQDNDGDDAENLNKQEILQENAENRHAGQRGGQHNQ